ncbi:MAG: T9SS type A sorting domain-containing protein [Lewinellaceae bacterium]|nr:T9SS type A sorting domain-containing protein [Lewinellaceae bacterium]
MKVHYPFFAAVFAALSLIPVRSSGQTMHEVTASNTKFEPASLSIQVGDTVRWTNEQGTHNVNGTTATFPSNPESFGNSVGAGWVYTHVFTIAGDYDYQCDPHAALGMTGNISVSPVSTVKDPGVAAENGMISALYPVPATDHVVLGFSADLPYQAGQWSAAVCSLTGQEVTRTRLTGTSCTFSTGNWTSGIYFVRLIHGNEVVDSRMFIVQ